MEDIGKIIDSDDYWAITVWKDGTSKVWPVADAERTRNDPNWLTEIKLSEALSDVEEQQKVKRNDPRYLNALEARAARKGSESLRSG